MKCTACLLAFAGGVASKGAVWLVFAFSQTTEVQNRAMSLIRDVDPVGRSVVRGLERAVFVPLLGEPIPMLPYALSDPLVFGVECAIVAFVLAEAAHTDQETAGA